MPHTLRGAIFSGLVPSARFTLGLIFWGSISTGLYLGAFTRPLFSQGCSCADGNDCFVRGDVDGDGALTYGDIRMWAEASGVYGGSPIGCYDATDIDDDGETTSPGSGIGTDLAEVSMLSNYIFQGGPPPAEPFCMGPSDPPPCEGCDPTTTDDFDCVYYDPSAAYVKHDLIIPIDRRADLYTLTWYEQFGITLEEVLAELIASSPYPYSTTPLQLYQNWWASVTGNGSQLATQDPFAPDPTPGDGIPNLDSYLLTAIVNRFDLRAPNWGTCGELRLIFSKVGGFENGSILDRNQISFEAEIPNPTPGSQSGCDCYFQKWEQIEANGSDDFTKAYNVYQMLFVNANCANPAQPAIDFDLFKTTATLGQIRTNTFIVAAEYAYREFKLEAVASTSSIRVKQIKAANSITPTSFGLTSGSNFTSFKNFLTQVVPTFIHATTLDELKFVAPIPSAFQALNVKGFSGNDGTREDYFGKSSQQIRDHIQTLINSNGGAGLTIKNVLDRMNVISCAGCHSTTMIHKDPNVPTPPLHNSLRLMLNLGAKNGNPILNRATPFPFHHVHEFGMLSPGLRTEFLKTRNTAWTALGY